MRSSLAEYDLSGIPTAPEPPAAISGIPGVEVTPGQILAGRYEVVSRLGAGGMGTVWRAHDRELDEDIALKVLFPGRLDDKATLACFRRELKIARRITHANVCRVFDLGEADGLRFLTMELIEGRSLRAVLAAGALDPLRALALLQEIANGLAAAHDQGVIHRDLKPENVMVRRSGQAIVADFGLARCPLTELTSVAAIAGTPTYMSPEQLRGEPLSVRSDVFTLGVLGFELLTGRSPFGEGSLASISSAILRDPPLPLSVPTLSIARGRALEALLVRAMEKLPERRFASAGGFAAALSALMTDPSPEDDGATLEEITRTDPPMATLSVRPRQVNWGFRTAVTALLGMTLLAAQGRSAPLLEGGAEGAPAAAAGQIHEGPRALADSRPRVVVEPFENLTGEASWASLGQGAAEAIRGGLRTLSQVRSVEMDEPGSPAIVAVDPGSDTASWIIAGSVQRVGRGIRLAAQLRATDGSAAGEPIDVDEEDGNLPHALELLRERAKDEVRLAWRGYDRRARADRGTRVPAARAALLRYYAMVGPAPLSQHFDEGMRLLDAALTADPGYVPALVERAYLQSSRASSTMDPALHAAALADLDRGLARDPGDAPARVLRCRVLQLKLQSSAHPTDADMESALGACNAALQADPSSPHVLLAFARLYDHGCQNDLAVDALAQALDLDRSLSGRILEQLVVLALHENRMQLADQMSARLVSFAEEQSRLGARSLARRAGVPPTRAAHVLRAAVLMRLQRLAAAQDELERELVSTSGQAGDRWAEAAAIRGILRLAEQRSLPAPPLLAPRLAALERQYVAAGARDPHVAQIVAGAYQWTDPAAAASWLDRLGAPDSFVETFGRSLFYSMAGDEAAARRILASREPEQQWERTCQAWMRSRLSQPRL